MPSGRLSTQPLYLQLRSSLTGFIATGQWKPGALLPNENDLAREFGVSPGTVRKALDLLEAEHLVIRRQGRGTFVNGQTARELAARFCRIRRSDGAAIVARSLIDSIAEGESNEVERVRLGLALSDRVYRFRRIQIDNDDPVMVEDVSVPAKLFADLAEMINVPDAILELALKQGILFGSAQESIHIGRVTPPIAKALRIAPASPVFILDRVLNALDERPVEWRVAHCHIADKHYIAEMR